MMRSSSKALLFIFLFFIFSTYFISLSSCAGDPKKDISTENIAITTTSTGAHMIERKTYSYSAEHGTACYGHYEADYFPPGKCGGPKNDTVISCRSGSYCQTSLRYADWDTKCEGKADVATAQFCDVCFNIGDGKYFIMVGCNTTQPEMWTCSSSTCSTHWCAKKPAPAGRCEDHRMYTYHPCSAVYVHRYEKPGCPGYPIVSLKARGGVCNYGTFFDC